MESPLENVTAVNSRFIKVTPDQLRELANRMETQARENCLPGDLVLVPFTRSITFIFDPELGFVHWKGTALESNRDADTGFHPTVQ